MPVKKRRSKARPHPITPEAVLAWRTGDESEVRTLLGLKPWQLSPFDAAQDCPYPTGTMGEQSYQLAQQLRMELEVADADQAPRG